MKNIKWIFAALVVALLVYEAVALSNGTDGDTISEIIWRVGDQYGVVKFLAGVICGHFFWARR